MPAPGSPWPALSGGQWERPGRWRGSSRRWIADLNSSVAAAVPATTRHRARRCADVRPAAAGGAPARAWLACPAVTARSAAGETAPRAGRSRVCRRISSPQAPGPRPVSRPRAAGPAPAQRRAAMPSSPHPRTPWVDPPCGGARRVRSSLPDFLPYRNHCAYGRRSATIAHGLRRCVLSVRGCSDTGRRRLGAWLLSVLGRGHPLPEHLLDVAAVPVGHRGAVGVPEVLLA